MNPRMAAIFCIAVHWWKLRWSNFIRITTFPFRKILVHRPKRETTWCVRKLTRQYKYQPSGVMGGGGGRPGLLPYVNYLGKCSEKSMVLSRFGLK